MIPAMDSIFPRLPNIRRVISINGTNREHSGNLFSYREIENIRDQYAQHQESKPIRVFYLETKSTMAIFISH
jgi:hypothetical protein